MQECHPSISAGIEPVENAGQPFKFGHLNTRRSFEIRLERLQERVTALSAFYSAQNDHEAVRQLEKLRSLA